jgi:hypothetical protein
MKCEYGCEQEAKFQLKNIRGHWYNNKEIL